MCEKSRRYSYIKNLFILMFLFLWVTCDERKSYCFGWNQYGVCGVGDKLPHKYPVKVGYGNAFDPLEKPFRLTFGGYRHTFLIVNGTANYSKVYGFGTNYNCMLGFVENHSIYPQPTELKFFEDEKILVKKINSNFGHSVVLTTKGEIYSWGENENGQLGIGSMNQICSPRKIATTKDFGIDISTGQCHTLLVYGNRSVGAAGCNFNNQLGPLSGSQYPSVTLLDFHEPVKVASAGPTYSIFLTVENDIWFTGQLDCNDGESLSYTNFTKLIDGNDYPQGFKHLHAGFNHFVTLFQDGEGLIGYGCNDYHSLGNLPKNESRWKIVEIDISPIPKKNRKIKNVVAMKMNTIVLLEAGDLYYLGQNLSIPLFENEGKSPSSYKELTNLNCGGEKIVDMDASMFHLTAISKEYNFCWGENEFYQCGITPRNWIKHFRNAFSNEFIEHEISDICLGVQHGLAISSEGHVFSFGDGSLGQLGYGSFDSHHFPVDIDLKGVKIIKCDATPRTGIVIDDKGIAYTFGSDDAGLLGTGYIGAQTIARPLPAESFSGRKLVDVGANEEAIIALTNQNELFVWGQNSNYELGLGKSIRSSPDPVMLNITSETLDPETNTIELKKKKILRISAGSQSNMVITEGSPLQEVWEWGTISSDPIFMKKELQVSYQPRKTFEGKHINLIVAGRNWNIIVNNSRELYIRGVVDYRVNNENNENENKEYENNDKYCENGVCRYANYTLKWTAPGNNRIVDCYSHYHTVCLLSNGSAFGFGDNSHLELTPFNDSLFYKDFIFLDLERFFGPDTEFSNLTFSRVKLTPFTTILMEEVKCYGKMDSEFGVCSNHGTCLMDGTCSCWDGFAGKECNQDSCFGINHQSKDVCSGSGFCDSPNHCDCYENNIGNFEGDECQISFCRGSSGQCNNHGNCVPKYDGKLGHFLPFCECDSEWTGALCDKAVCKEKCIHYEECTHKSKKNKNICQCNLDSMNQFLPLQRSTDGPCEASTWKLLVLLFVIFQLIFSGCCCCIFVCSLCYCLCLQLTRMKKMEREKDIKDMKEEKMEGFDSVLGRNLSLHRKFDSYVSLDSIDTTTTDTNTTASNSTTNKNKSDYDYEDINAVSDSETSIIINLEEKEEIKQQEPKSMIQFGENSPLLLKPNKDKNKSSFKKKIRDYHSLPTRDPNDGILHKEKNRKVITKQVSFQTDDIIETYYGEDEEDEDDEEKKKIEEEEEFKTFRFSPRKEKKDLKKIKLSSNHVFIGDINGEGIIYFHFSNNKKKLYPVFRGNFKNGKRNGFGVVYREHPYEKNNIHSGFWDDTSYIRLEGMFHDDMREGRCKEYDTEGRLCRVSDWKNDFLLRVQDLNIPLKVITYKELKEFQLLHNGWDSDVFKCRLENEDVVVKIYKSISEKRKQLEEKNNKKQEEEEEEENLPIIKMSDGTEQSLLVNYLENRRADSVVSMLKIISIFPHPNLIRILGYSGENSWMNQKFFYVMENCEMSVNQRILKSQNILKEDGKVENSTMKKLNIEEKIKILYQIAKGMCHLHDVCGLIHRDLKLENVLLDSFNEAKIGDLDLADRDKMEISGKKNYLDPCGSPFHIAPEVLLSKGFESSCDVYSFSIMIYELLFDERVKDPFDILRTKKCPKCKKEVPITDDLSPSQLSRLLFNEMRVHHKCGIRPPLNDVFIQKEIQWLVKLMKKCWAKDPHKRPSFKKIVEQFIRNEKIRIKKKKFKRKDL